MTALNSILVLIIVFLAVFWEAAFNGFRYWIGAQVDVLPALAVYASLSTDLGTLTAVCVGGGLLFDSLSANPLGTTVPALVSRRFRDLFETRLDFTRPALCPACLGIHCERFGAVVLGFDSPDIGKLAASWLGIALAMAGNERRRQYRRAVVIHVIWSAGENIWLPASD